MSKKNIVAFIIISIIAVSAVLFLLKDQVEIDFNSEEKGLLFDTNSINHIIDYHVDRNGYIYYIDYVRNKSTSMLKISPTGELVFAQILPTEMDGKQLFYTKIEVDDNGNIYLLTALASRGDRIIEKEWVRKYDVSGKFITNVYEVTHTTTRVMDNPFLSASGRIINMHIYGDDIYLFDRTSSEQVALIKFSSQTADDTKNELKILRMDTEVLREIIYTEADEIWFLNRRAEIYRVNEDNSVDKLIDNKDKIIPQSLSSDSRGTVYFTDVYNRQQVRVNMDSLQPELLYELSNIVSAENNLTLGELRNLRIYNDQQLVGHTAVSKQGYNAFAIYNPASANKVIDRVAISFQTATSNWGLWFVSAIIISLLIVVMINIITGRIGLVTKQIIIFLPAFIAVMLGLVLFVTMLARDATLEGTNERLSTVVEKTSKLMDAELFNSLEMPKNDFNEDFKEIERQVNVGDRVIYYITYRVEDNNIYAAVSNSVQSYTPIEFIFDKETVAIYYEVLNSGQTKLGDTVDFMGDWVFAATPIYLNGEIIGILEHGVDASKIYENINATSLHLTILMVGIGLVLAIAYLIMLHFSLRALTVLKNSVAQVASGRWDTRVDIKTQDEFRDIGQAFNRMSDHIQSHIHDITRLNQAYVKFVPEEIFAILGKKTALDVQLGEQVTEQMAILFINVRAQKLQTSTVDAQSNYQFLNNILQIIADKVTENYGVVERFEGAGAVALFQHEPTDALRAALAIQEDFRIFNKKSNDKFSIGMAIDNGPVLLGIVGHEQRMSTTVIAQSLNNAYNMEIIGSKIGVHLSMTEQAFQSLVDNDKYSYRKIGKIINSSSEQELEIIEFFDSYQTERKLNMRNTKELLEEGLVLFSQHDYSAARKKFIQIIRMDRDDQLARKWLFICEQHLQAGVSTSNNVLSSF